MEEQAHATQGEHKHSADWILHEQEAKEWITSWWKDALKSEPPYIKNPELDYLVNSTEFKNNLARFDELHEKFLDDTLSWPDEWKEYRTLDSWFRLRSGAAAGYQNPEFNTYDPCICPPRVAETEQ